MPELICLRKEISPQHASYIFDLLSVNQIHCLLDSEGSSVPDLQSGGKRNILVEPKDQAKAERLLSELAPPETAPEEYQEDLLGPKRRHLLSLIAERFFHRPSQPPN